MMKKFILFISTIRHAEKTRHAEFILGSQKYEIPKQVRNDVSGKEVGWAYLPNNHVVPSPQSSPVGRGSVADPSSDFVSFASSTTKATSPVGGSARKAAFSLIEALIILLIISITIMISIPLLTQKLSIPRWIPVKKENGATSTISYGAHNADRVAIGTDASGNQLLPTTAGQEGKFVTNTIAIENDTNIDAFDESSITWGVHNENNTYSPSTFTLANNTRSILVGNNLCEVAGDVTPRNVIRIGHHVSGLAAADNAVVNSCANNLVNIRASAHSQIRAIGDNTVIATDNSAIVLTNAENTIMSNIGGVNTNLIHYNRATDTLILNSFTTQNDLYLSGYTPTVDSEDYTSDCKSNKWVTDHENNLTYCSETTQWWSSDKRLKNILGEYTKGMKELLKVDTYLYTFKADKKQELHAGILAQKLKGIFDEAVRKNDDGYYSYEKEPLFYAMVNAVKSINQKQKDIATAQKRMNEDADRIIRMYK